MLRFLCCVCVVLIGLDAIAKGERERIQVLGARVRAATPRTMPDTPPNLRLRNLPRASMTFSDDLQVRAIEVTVYTASWCGPCESAKRRGGGGDARVRLKWVEQAPPSPIKEQYPTYVWRDSAGDLRYAQGVHTLDQLWDRIQRNNPPKHEHAVAGVGGSFEGRSLIETGQQQWRERIGEGRTISVRWDRTGSQQLELLHGDPWTVEQICGKYGHFEVSADIAALPVKTIGIGYRVDEGKVVLDLDPLTIEIPDGARTVGVGDAAGIDPITLGWGVLSLGRMLYQMLNPQVDLMLPGHMQATAVLNGEQLVITFDDCPGIRVQAWFEWRLELVQVVISPTNIHVEFKPQPGNWFKIKSRDFPVTENSHAIGPGRTAGGDYRRGSRGSAGMLRDRGQSVGSHPMCVA